MKKEFIDNDEDWIRILEKKYGNINKFDIHDDRNKS